MMKKNINLWDISYKDDGLEISSVFNSGFIDDIDVVKAYIIKSYLNICELKIKKTKK